MTSKTLKSILWYVLLLLAQVLVLNHIHLFQCATPLLYIYVVIGIRRNFPKWLSLTAAFITGLIVDIFANTPGVAAASMTFIALIQPYLLLLFMNRESPEDLKPTLRTLGFARFIYFALPLILIFCLLFFTLETFNFFNWMRWLECIGGSTLLTLILILAIENIRKNNG